MNNKELLTKITEHIQDGEKNIEHLDYTIRNDIEGFPELVIFTGLGLDEEGNLIKLDDDKLVPL